MHQNGDSALIASGMLSSPPKKLWTTTIPTITHASAAVPRIRICSFNKVPGSV